MKYDLSQLQIYSNTLQAIAAGYLISSILILNFGIVMLGVFAGVLLKNQNYLIIGNSVILSQSGLPSL